MNFNRVATIDYGLRFFCRWVVIKCFKGQEKSHETNSECARGKAATDINDKPQKMTD